MCMCWSCRELQDAARSVAGHGTDEQPSAIILQTVVMFIMFLFGSVVRMITGYGSAIVTTGLWAVLRLVTDSVVTFQQLVAANLWNMWTTGFYLSLSTNARVNASRPIVLASFVAQVPGGALGSLALSALPSWLLELITGSVILLSLAMSQEIK